MGLSVFWVKKDGKKVRGARVPACCLDGRGRDEQRVLVICKKVSQEVALARAQRMKAEELGIEK